MAARLKVVPKEKSEAPGVLLGELDALQLSIVLKHCEPRIQRTLVVHAEISFGELHSLIQTVMGWEDHHLHEFIVGDHHIGPDPEDDPFRDGDMSDENDVRIMDLLPLGKGTMRYIYDFGDNWVHEIKVRRLDARSSAGLKPPVCTGGTGACPPEDCGGPWGYMEMLHELRGGSPLRKKEIRSLLGVNFDPKAFDIVAVNKALR